MANYVKISSIGPAPLSVEPDEKPQRIVEQVIDFWKGKLEQVLPDRPDLIVVPEASDRPANYPNKRYYRTRGDQVRDFFAGVARQNECYIAYSWKRHIKEDNTWRNSTMILDRSGKVAGIYNKNHVTIKERTQEGILYGKEAPLIECDFGRVACAICFDLNFDELRLKYVKAKPDLLLFSSVYHGGLMQRYWAYSCRCYFVGAIARSPCAIISPVSEIVASSTNYFDYVTATVNLDCRVCHLDYNRGRLQAMKVKYGPKVNIEDPGYLGAVLVSSETDEFTVQEVIEEFEVEILDDYMQRALAHRYAPGNIEE